MTLTDHLFLTNTFDQSEVHIQHVDRKYKPLKKKKNSLCPCPSRRHLLALWAVSSSVAQRPLVSAPLLAHGEEDGGAFVPLAAGSCLTQAHVGCPLCLFLPRPAGI